MDRPQLTATNYKWEKIPVTDMAQGRKIKCQQRGGSLGGLRDEMGEGCYLPG